MRKNNRRFLFLLIGLSSFWAVNSFALVLAEPVDRIELHDKSVQDVLKLVSQHSGYEVLMVGDPGARKISGIFYLSDIEAVLRRIFKSSNTFVEFYEDEKRIIVKLPGEKIFTRFSGEKKFVHGADQIDPDTGLSYQEIMERREQDKKDHLAYMNDPESIDPDTGLSYLEVVARREQDKKDHLAFMNNPESKDPDSGLSYQDLMARREQDKKDHLAFMNDPGSIDPDTGLSYLEIMKRRAREK